MHQNFPRHKESIWELFVSFWYITVSCNVSYVWIEIPCLLFQLLISIGVDGSIVPNSTAWSRDNEALPRNPTDVIMKAGCIGKYSYLKRYFIDWLKDDYNITIDF